MIYLTGDTHGDIDVSKLNTKNFPEGSSLTKDDYVIILGDFGFIWKNEPDKTEEYWMKWFQKKPWTTLFVDGNHENHNRLENFPIEEWHGGKVHKINDSVIHLMRGQVFDINGIRFFAMGGAPSIDKVWRAENISWWKQEEINYQEQEEALKNLEKINNKVDYIISHTCPKKIIPYTFHISPNSLMDSSTEKFFDYIAQIVDFDDWYFGHWHEQKNIGKYHCLYNNIVNLPSPNAVGV